MTEARTAGACLAALLGCLPLAAVAQAPVDGASGTAASGSTAASTSTATTVPRAAIRTPSGAGAGATARGLTGLPIDIGMVLDGGFASRELALGLRPKGFGLGHNELTLGGVVDQRFAGRLTVIAHSHGDRVEAELEEAFVEPLGLPLGLQTRAGRFLSQVGYLNELHLHADDFAERPLLYRGFLGNHYFDNGVRLNWVAPTPFYWRTGVEVLGGRQLVEQPERRTSAGVVTVGTKVGGDIGLDHSWQLGLSYLRNRLGTGAAEEGHDHDHDHDHGDDHGHDHDAAGHAHSHGARYRGRHMAIVDAVWKWAPAGNNRDQQVRVSAEYARVTGLGPSARTDKRHEAWYVAAVYRFRPQWEAGVRLNDLKVQEPHEDHFDPGRLQESSIMLAWRPSHFSVLRLQWTKQRNRGGFTAATNSLMLQYVMSLGAHGAHAF